MPTRTELVFAAFQGPVLSVDSPVVHMYRSYTAELLVPRRWRLALGLSTRDVFRSLLHASVRAEPSPASPPLRCAQCAGVVELSGTWRHPERLPDDLESYCTALRSKCTSSRRHLKAATLVLTADVGGVTVCSDRFAVFAREPGSVRAEPSPASPPLRCAQCAGVVELSGTWRHPERLPDDLESYCTSLRSKCTSSRRHLKAATLVLTADVGGVTVCSDRFAVFAREPGRYKKGHSEQSEQLHAGQNRKPRPAGDLVTVGAWAGAEPTRDLWLRSGLMLTVEIIKPVPNDLPPCSKCMVEGVSRALQMIPGFLMQKSCVRGGLDMMVFVRAYRTAEDAAEGDLVCQRFSKNIVPNPVNLDVSTVVTVLAHCRSWAQWLTRAIVSHFFVSPSRAQAAQAALLTAHHVTEFLDDSNTTVLVAVLPRGKDEVALSFGVGDNAPAGPMIAFTKSRKAQVTEENMAELVSVTTISRSPAQSFADVVSNLYAPLLLKEGGSLPLAMKTALTELQSSLEAQARKGASVAKGVDDTDVSGICKLSDEFGFWADISQQPTSGPDAIERGRVLTDLYKPLVSLIEDINSRDISEVAEILDRAQETLDSIWKLKRHNPYPEERMVHVLRLFGLELVRFLQYKLGSFDIWKDTFPVVKEQIRRSIGLLDKWEGIALFLTSEAWPVYTHRKWTTAYRDEYLALFRSRLSEVLSLRTSHEHIVSLGAEMPQGATDQLRKVQPLYCGPLSQQQWSDAVASYGKTIAGPEARAASALKRQLAPLGPNPFQLMNEFQRYRDLVSRPNVSRELAPEREMLLAQVSALVNAIREEWIGNIKAKGSTDTTELVSSVLWARQLISKIDGAAGLADALLKDLPAFQKFSLVVTSLKSELDAFQKGQFATWVKETAAAIEDTTNTASMRKFGQQMEIGMRESKAFVEYSDKLVAFLREVRQLTALSFVIPSDIKAVADVAARYQQGGIVLKQLGNFYNRVLSEILPCQRSMLLELCVAFEEVVKSAGKGSVDQKTVFWKVPNDVEIFIDRLQRAAEKVAAENCKLRKYHIAIAEKVCKLSGTDLLKQENAWTEEVREIRGIFTSLQEQGHKPQRMQAWMVHWDHQLYKALELQYQRGLSGLSDSIGDIPCELVFKQHQLQFKPPLEVMRTQYYTQLQKFIKFPQVFKGVGGAPTIFRSIADRNSKNYINVYKRAEELFERAEREKDQFGDWLALASVDIEMFTEENLKETADWEYNFKLIKQKRLEAEKLPKSRRIGCIAISFAPVLASIEDLMQRLQDALVNSLSKSIRQSISDVEGFVDSAVDKLSQRPTSGEEIAEAVSMFTAIIGKKRSARGVLHKCEEKTKLLRLVTGQAASLAALQAKWENMDVSIQSHEQMVHKQTELFKAEIARRSTSFTAEIQKYSSKWAEIKPRQSAMLDATEAEQALAALRSLKEEYEELEKQKQQAVADCKQFNVDVPHFPMLDILRDEIAKMETVWKVYQEYAEGKGAMSSELWLSFRTKTYVFEDFIGDWEAKARAARDSGQKDLDWTFVTRDMEKFKELVPLLKFLRGDVFLADHWKVLFNIIGLPRTQDFQRLTFGGYLGVIDKILANAAMIKDLHQRANGEVTIREAIEELKAWGADTRFTLTDHEEAGRVTPLIKEWKEIITAIGDNQALLNSLKDSPYFRPFADEARQWEHRLASLDKNVRSLNIVQRKWLYLEPIFTRGALPQEEARFKSIDCRFVEIMKDVERNPKVVLIADTPGMGDTLAMLQEQLDRCQNALSAFLEEKRSKFARFYFLGDDDLLEILGQSRNPAVIQTHLKKLFQGINRVEFSGDGKLITAMRSIAGEVVPLEQPVEVVEKVETWLNNLAEQMKTTLRHLLVQCLQNFDLQQFPSQILNLAEDIHFTTKCENAIRSANCPQMLAALEKETRDTLERLALLDTGDDKVLALKIKSILYDIIHNLDVVIQLKAAGIKSLAEWSWQKQLRYYMTDKDLCIIRMGEATCDYTYEYQGNAPKLVYTPLTDKCYLTLTQGMMKGYGGNPYGPAGTGKTESVKALGQVMGRQVLVFNCDEGIDFKSMGRMFTGLIKCGAWGCFDEFNRLDEEVLSAVSQQIQVIQGALKNKAPTVTLLEKTIEVDLAAGIFVTLNPAGKNYGGRSKLPDNLKQLFRPVAMSVPDLDLIAEVMLYSEGFTYAKAVGEKLVAVFRLSRQLLSPQQHYDWGLRALKSILGAGGLLVQDAKKKARASPSDKALVVDKTRESEIIVQAARVNTLSKLIHADRERFKGLIKDLFPNATSADVEDEELQAAVRTVLEKQKLAVLDTQKYKIMQLNENLKQRMGVVVVGPSGCGKSVLWRTLRAALQEMKIVVNQYTMNPKAIPRQQLLGVMDQDTREWTDGILTAACKQVVKEPLETRNWIICDGDVDPEWIESLNSVLDDNRLLTLPTGERIQFGPNVNFLFESDNLKYASPATVSRMGMIFMDENDISKPAIIDAWLLRQPPECQAPLRGFIETYFDRALKLALKETLTVETTLVGTLKNGLSHLNGVKSKLDFMLGLCRGFGGNMQTERRSVYAREVFAWFGENPINRQRPLDCYVDQRGTLAPFKSRAIDIPISELHMEPMVPTVEALSNVALIMPCLNAMEPFVVVGPEGCGKNMLLRYCFAQLKSTSVATLHCSSQTTATHVIQKLNQACTIQSSTTGRVYRPKDAERLILYLKDINLPKPDKYETMQLISFLQQLLTYSGFYDNGEWLTLERIQIVASMTPSSTMGRYPLSGRFTSIVRVFSMSYPDKDQLQEVYAAYFKTVASAATSNPQWVQPKTLEKLAASMLEVYENVRAKFSPDDHAHYLFTPRDLTKWVRGILSYNVDSVAGDLMEVWSYEAQRIFRDKLVGKSGVERFDQVLSAVLKSQWERDPYPVGSSYFVTWADPVAAAQQTAAAATAAAAAQAQAAGAAGGQGGEAQKKPASVKKRLSKMAVDALKNQVKRGILMFEREVKELHLSLFPDVFDHIARVDRVLSQPGGALLLVGKSGVGRCSTAQLVSYMSKIRVFTPSMGRGYSTKMFTMDLKGVLQSAGVAGEPVVLLLEDHQLVEPTFIEYINSLLSAGEIPGLYAPEELDGLLCPLKDQINTDGFFGSLFDYFVSRVRENLHVVLVMDQDNKEFQARCQSNPALYTRCSMQWWDQWGHESLAVLAGESLKYTLAEAPKSIRPVIDYMVQMYQGAMPRGATPRSFVRLLDTYKRVYESKFKEANKRKSNLVGGLTKLSEAAQTVDKLSTEATQKRTELEKANDEANRTMNEIEKKMEHAAKSKEEMKELQEKLGVEEKKLSGQKETIEEQLGRIQPLVDSARAAVSCINKSNLDEIRVLRTPGAVIRDIMEGVVRIMGQADTSWNGIKSFLSKSGVVNEIMKFDPGTVKPEVRVSVEQLLKEKAKSFEPDTAKFASQAALPLATWVSASVEYSKVKETVCPLEEKLAAATAKLSSSRNKLAELESGLKKIDEEVARLKKTFQRMTQDASRLQIALEETQSTLDQAQSLLSKLSGERDRWQQQARTIETELESLPASSLLAAAYITYLVSASEEVRAEICGEWCTLVGLKDWSFSRFIGSESELLTLKGEGLPADNLSMDNALALEWTTGVPLLIDPSSQAAAWLLRHLKKDSDDSPSASDGAEDGGDGEQEAPAPVPATMSSLKSHSMADLAAGGDGKKPQEQQKAPAKRKRQIEVTTQEDPKFVNKLELAVRFGKTLIVQEIDRIQPILYPIIRKDLVRQGAQMAVQIGDKPMTYSDDFCLYLVTRDPFPDLPPDARALLTETNFTVTRSGLEGQLLMTAIQHEKPELEKTKMMHLLREEEEKIQMARLEEQLLEQLAKSEGNILQNKELIASLETTKEKSVIIAQSLAASKKAQEELEVQRNVYKPIARCGSSLYFVMQDLGKVNHMYRFSLTSFLPLFNRALQSKAAQQGGGGAIEQRIAAVNQTMLVLTLEYVSRSLFKADRLMFGMHLSHEWEFLTGQTAGAIVDGKDARAPAWVPKDRATSFAELAQEAPQVAQALGSDDGWSKWVAATDCENQWPQTSLSPFQRVLLIKSVRPDRLESAMLKFAVEALGVSTLSPPALNLARFCKEETTPKDPVLLIVTPGADPSQELEELAEKVIGAGNYTQVAMGQGQQEVALQAIRGACAKGGWVILKNLHLAISWLPTLEKELNMMQPHENFRLWLTAEAHARFSTILLQSSIKITYEAPPGIKKNLERTFENWTEEFFAQGSAMRAQTLFVLAWFHSVIQERRKYIPQSWTKFYEFNEADLRAATDVIDRTFAKASEAGTDIDWQTVHGLLENAVYGGRVDNSFDFAILQTYLRQFLCPELLSPSGPKRPLATGPKVDIPTGNDRQAYASAIAKLPELEPPSFFGLPANIDRSLQRTNSARVISQLKLIAIPAEAGSRFNREQWAAQLSPIILVWQKLTEGNAALVQPLSEPDDPSRPPVDSFVVMEAINAHSLASIINSSLSNIIKVISGRMLLTPEIQQVGSLLLRGQVPRAWELLWEGPESPISWLRALVHKTVALDRWLKAVREGTLFKAPLNLNDLFRPATFLDALRQQSARAEKRTVDEMKLVTVWSSAVKVASKLPVVIDGLLIQGCALEGGRMSDASASAAELVGVPKCLLAWVPSETPSPYEAGSVADIPVYQNLLREKIVTTLAVPCTPPPEKWILAGVALFLSEE
eukprot:m51a1_g4339 putative cytoplasmic dynein 2 heavy chain 1 isoform x1 (4695) ;mRNA; f:164362-180818